MSKHKIGAFIPENHVAKNGGRREFLPSRSALAMLTKGDPAERTMNWYAKRTPSGLGAPNTYADIQQMGEKGIDVENG